MEHKQRQWNVVERLLDRRNEGRANAGARMGAGAEKVRTKNAYEWFNQKLNELKFGRYAFFLNYGYVPNGNPSWSVIIPPSSDFDLNSRRLVLEVIGDCPVDGRDVLDVSCGRGSVATVLRDYFHPRSYCGIDISSEAIAFCRKYQQTDGFRFEEGDAESLAIEPAAFDVVINIEASHNYPHVHSFIAEVYRVLRPGGWFLYTDLGTPRGFERNIRLARQAGLEMSRNVDITSNVLLSCGEIAERRLKVYHDAEERAMMADFLAVPGSRTGRAFEDGSLCYRLFTFRKPGA
jgi:phthiocerol/phenolphthiocerol synthesis type-I polyketide synthase E